MKKRKFKLHWLSGCRIGYSNQEEIVSAIDTGDQHQTLANVMMLAGYGGGVLAALDYWEEISDAVKITITARELLDRGLWDQACELIGLNVWAINEGLMDSSDEVTLTQEQAQKLGLLSM